MFTIYYMDYTMGLQLMRLDSYERCVEFGKHCDEVIAIVPRSLEDVIEPTLEERYGD